MTNAGMAQKTGRVVRGGAASFLAMMAMAPAADAAVNWMSSSNPLVVTGYGSTGEGYGTWQVSTGSNGTRFHTSVTQRIDDADNHKVWAQIENWTNAGSCFQPDYTSCTPHEV